MSQSDCDVAAYRAQTLLPSPDRPVRREHGQRVDVSTERDERRAIDLCQNSCPRPQLRVLILVGSGTEARSLTLVAEALTHYEANVTFWHVGNAGNGDSHSALKRRQITADHYLRHVNSAKTKDAIAGFDVLLVGNDNLTPNVYLIKLFQSLSKPTYLLQEGLTGDANLFNRSALDLLRKWPRSRQYLSHYRRTRQFSQLATRAASAFTRTYKGQVYGAGGTDHYFVASEPDAQLARRRSQLRTSVSATGIPGLFSASTDLQNCSDGDSRKPVKALLLTSPLYQVGYGTIESHRAFWLDVIKSLSRAGIEDVRLRFHPSHESAADYKFLRAAVTVLEGTTMAEDLSSTTFCVAVVSTTVLEARAAGKDVFTVNPAGYFPAPVTSLSEVAKEVTYHSENVAKLDSVIRSRSTRCSAEKNVNFQEIYRPSLDGLAQHRIAKKILSHEA